ncbi:MAG: hypothetical protein OXG71_02265 [Rhodospirillales bacterium]|nr:hypothetical protein [Rhodospirillales bacterium]
MPKFPGVDDGSQEPIYRIAAKVLGNRHDPAGFGGGPLQGICCRNGDRDRFFYLHVQPDVERSRADQVVGRRRGYDVDRVGPFRRGHITKVGVYRRANIQQLFGQLRGRAGRFRERVANPDQIERVYARPFQLCEPMQVASTHATAADERQFERFGITERLQLDY